MFGDILVDEAVVDDIQGNSQAVVDNVFGQPPDPDMEYYLEKYVAILYQNFPYPCFLEDINSTDLYVECMLRIDRNNCNNCFLAKIYKRQKHWYPVHQIVSIIPEPIKVIIHVGSTRWMLKYGKSPCISLITVDRSNIYSEPIHYMYNQNYPYSQV